MNPTGLLLAAGAGRRAGGPKALRRDDDGTPWLRRSLEVLAAGGCERLTVVLGAGVDQARTLVPAGVRVVVAGDWADGLSASLRAGLRACAGDRAAVCIHLVDLPDVSADVVRRVLAAGAEPDVLVRAGHGGRPGHPVLVGSGHQSGVLASLDGDTGGQSYLEAHGVRLLECGDLATGHDQDHNEEPNSSSTATSRPA